MSKSQQPHSGSSAYLQRKVGNFEVRQYVANAFNVNGKKPASRKGKPARHDKRWRHPGIKNSHRCFSQLALCKRRYVERHRLACIAMLVPFLSIEWRIEAKLTYFDLIIDVHPVCHQNCRNMIQCAPPGCQCLLSNVKLPVEN